MQRGNVTVSTAFKTHCMDRGRDENVGRMCACKKGM